MDSARSVSRQLTQNMTPRMPAIVQDIDQNAEQRGIDEVLNRGDVAGDPHDQVAAPRFVVLRQRKPLNVLVDGLAEVVRDPLDSRA